MKRVILSTMLLIGVATFAAAQSSGSTGSATGSGASTSAPKSAKSKKPSDKLNNRKIYHFNNGQRSTPTGAEATPSNSGGGYAALGKDTAPSVASSGRNSAVTKKTTAKRRKQ